jgi:F0F1-type ATP synthase membrane subunit b/b'
METEDVVRMWDDMDKWELIAEIKQTRNELIEGWCEESERLNKVISKLQYELKEKHENRRKNGSN